MGERATVESGMGVRVLDDTGTRMRTLGNSGKGTRTLDNHGAIGTRTTSNLGRGTRELLYSRMGKRDAGEQGRGGKALGFFHERARVLADPELKPEP